MAVKTFFRRLKRGRSSSFVTVSEEAKLKLVIILITLRAVSNMELARFRIGGGNTVQSTKTMPSSCAIGSKVRNLEDRLL